MSDGRMMQRRASDLSGRYEMLGEIARGHIGVLFKGRDVDLGREVALKVLRDDHLENQELLQRFVIEAQVGAQLQHPGVVPVYELGLRAERVPFIAMRLVKGKTLAAILREGGRSGFLPIFEQICQTMAYAHSRGVIHRDLKPPNVMVGNFGEVQIVDWGFARVIHQRDLATRSGFVTGDPRYMSPEQARGALDELDERSDVFSLGAILCEMLTGAPPYGGRMEEAAEARQEGARAALADCGADPALIELALRCLAPRPGDRPRDAASIVNTVVLHLTAVEERAHKSALRTAEAYAETASVQRAAAEMRAARKQAALQAEEARLRARRQRRARRQTLALVAAVLIAVLVGGGGYLWLEADRAARAGKTRRRIDEAIQEAHYFRARERWTEARTAAKRAQDLAQASGADEETSVRVQSLLTTLDSARRAADEIAEDRAQDDRLVASLEAIRSRCREAGDLLAADDAYRAAFRDAGFDVLADAAGTGEALRARSRAVELAAALDHWAHLRRVHPQLDRRPAEPLVAVARAADPDPGRDAIRVALTGRDFAGLSVLAFSAPARLDGPTLTLLGLGLEETGDAEAVVAFLRRAYAEHPESAGLGDSLARSLQRLDPPRYAEAITVQTAALAVRPSATRYLALGRALAGDGRATEAVAALREAIRRAPNEPAAYDALARLRAETTDPRLRDAYEATDLARRAVELAPRVGSYRSTLGAALCRSRQWKEATQLLARETEDPRDRLYLALAHHHLGDDARTRAHLDAATAALGRRPDPSLDRLRAEVESALAGR